MILDLNRKEMQLLVEASEMFCDMEADNDPNDLDHYYEWDALHKKLKSHVEEIDDKQRSNTVDHSNSSGGYRARRTGG